MDCTALHQVTLFWIALHCTGMDRLQCPALQLVRCTALHCAKSHCSGLCCGYTALKSVALHSSCAQVACCSETESKREQEERINAQWSVKLLQTEGLLTAARASASEWKSKCAGSGTCFGSGADAAEIASRQAALELSVCSSALGSLCELVPLMSYQRTIIQYLCRNMTA